MTKDQQSKQVLYMPSRCHWKGIVSVYVWDGFWKHLEWLR